MKDRLLVPVILLAVGAGPVVVAGSPSSGSVTLPLRERIDAAIEAAHSGPFAGRSSDAEFLRRVCLDLVGVVPTASEARRFLGDLSAGKRRALIDRLISSSRHGRRQQDFFDQMFMERRGDKHVKKPAWRKYLLDRVREGIPYNEIAREILAADGVDAKLRPAAKFYLDREGNMTGITRDVGRVFFGMDLQCAQCHDHPLIKGYRQAMYHELYAYLGRSSQFTDKDKLVSIADKAVGETTFKSVFDKEEKTVTARPRLPTGKPLEEPVFEKGKEYEVAPAKGVRPVPKFSRRVAMATQATTGENRQFNRNIVNRLWALVMGRGLVHPVDLHHPDNPPSHPRLLDLLADEFVAMDFDVRAFLRELVLTRTYQRSSTPPGGAVDVNLLEERFAVAPLKPLEPEQLAWSFMQAVGVTEKQECAVRTSRVEAAGKAPATEKQEKAPATEKQEKAAAEQKQEKQEKPAPHEDGGRDVDAVIEAEVHDKLKGNVGPFVALFASLPGQTGHEFQATVQQALFFSNNDTISNWLGSAGGALAARLRRIEDRAILADELYLSVLTRLPTAAERRHVTDFLSESDDEHRAAALEGMIWALLTSVEFRFNH